LIAQRRKSRVFHIGRTRQLDSVFRAENSPQAAARGDILVLVALTTFGAVIFVTYSILTHDHPVRFKGVPEIVLNSTVRIRVL
jgi:hypothetical protein